MYSDAHEPSTWTSQYTDEATTHTTTRPPEPEASPPPATIETKPVTEVAFNEASVIQAAWRVSVKRRERRHLVKVLSLPRLLFACAAAAISVPTAAGLVPTWLAAGVLALYFAFQWLALPMRMLWSAAVERARRILHPPLQIPIGETTWCMDEMAELAPDQLLLGTDSATDGLSSALATSVTRIQATFRGKAAREQLASEQSSVRSDSGLDEASSSDWYETTGDAESSWGDSARSDATSASATPPHDSRRARAKWKSAAQEAQTYMGVISHWWSLVVAPGDKARLDKLANKNRPSHYGWLRGLLTAMARGQPPDAPDAKAGKRGTPLFVVAGACPSSFAGMQAVLYAAMEAEALGGAPTPTEPAVDFWWVKPQSAQPKALETLTLPRNAAGPHKNSPGASHAVYKPLADLFTSAQHAGQLRFTLERTSVATGRRHAPTRCAERWVATIRTADEPEVARTLCFVWQEAWSSPLAYSKWIAGKLLYLRSRGEVVEVCACPYRIDGKAVSVNVALEERIPTILPPDSFKLGCG